MKPVELDQSSFGGYTEITELPDSYARVDVGTRLFWWEANYWHDSKIYRKCIWSHSWWI